MLLPRTIKQLQKKSDALLDAIERHCQAEAAATGDFRWRRAAAAATADAYCLREGTMIYVIQASYRGGPRIFHLTKSRPPSP
jgi:hypothetical protein